MSMTLSRWSTPSIRSCRPGSVIAPLRSRARASRRMSPTSELLPEPLTPVTQTNRPSGISTSMSLRLCCRAPTIFRRRSVGGLRYAGTSIALRPERYWPVRLAGDLGELVERPLGDDLAPLDAGAGAEVDEVVGRAHRVLVVLDDDDRVADVAEPLEGGDQAVVVAGVEADRGLIEDVEHPDQPRADLAGQPDPLRLAAGERRRGAVERQVVQADVGQEPEPAADLLEQLLGDRPRERVERRSGVSSRRRSAGGLAGQGVEEPGDLADRHRAQLDERLAADADGPGAGVEPGPPAVGAGHAPHVGLELRAGRAAVGVAELGQQLVGDARPLLGVRPVLAPVLPAVDDHAVARAVEPGMLPPRVEVAPRALEHRPLGGAVGVGLEVGGDPFEEVPPPLAQLLDRPERLDRPVPDRQRRVGHEQRRGRSRGGRPGRRTPGTSPAGC